MAATCCSAPVAIIFTTLACPATSANLAAAARLSKAWPASMQFWARAASALPPIHPSDMCVALRALGAVVHVQSPRGTRAIAFADFHRLPESSPEIDTTLADDELITQIEPPPAANFAAHWFTSSFVTGLLMRLRWCRWWRCWTSTMTVRLRRRALRLAAWRTNPGATRRPSHC